MRNSVPEDEYEAFWRSSSVDSMSSQEAGGVRQWLREKLENLGMLPSKKTSNVTEHIKIGRPLTLEELFSYENEGLEAGEAAFWEWLTLETAQEYGNKWVVFTADGLVESANSKSEARKKAENKGLGLGDCCIRLIDPSLLKDADERENKNS